MNVLLELKEISKSFRFSAAEKEVTILKRISLQMDQGESIAVVGPSGSGKSTLLNIIGTLDKPTSGEVFFSGNNLADLDDAALSAIRNREMGFIFQLHHLL